MEAGLAKKKQSYRWDWEHREGKRKQIRKGTGVAFEESAELTSGVPAKEVDLH